MKLRLAKISIFNLIQLPYVECRERRYLMVLWFSLATIILNPAQLDDILLFCEIYYVRLVIYLKITMFSDFNSQKKFNDKENDFI